ncbi:prephenate dehydrogenase [Marisediminicola sp. UYEF4]
MVKHFIHWSLVTQRRAHLLKCVVLLVAPAFSVVHKVDQKYSTMRSDAFERNPAIVQELDESRAADAQEVSGLLGRQRL